MRLEYLPLLRRSLTAPLQPTADNNSGKDGIATVMELMNAYGFTKYVYISPHPRELHRRRLLAPRAYVCVRGTNRSV